MTEIPLRDVALAMAGSGMYVFPALAGQKRPATRNGFKDATRDPKMISSWWSANPHFNICIATEPSNLVVIDCDAGKPWPGDGQPPEGCQGGDDILVMLAQKAGIVPVDWMYRTEVPSVATPSGGIHLYYRKPKKVEIRSRANVAPWVDVRAKGGYVVAPYSSTPAGTYRPINGWHTIVRTDAGPDFTPIGIPSMESISFSAPRLPDWLIELVADKKGRAPDLDGGGDVLDLIRKRLDVPTVGSGTGYAAAAAVREVEIVRTSSPGTRNEKLNRAAYSLGTLAGAGLLEESDVQRHLEDAALVAGLDDVEIRRTIASGMRAGKASPRQVSGL
jgi:hypothetical protein